MIQLKSVSGLMLLGCILILCTTLVFSHDSGSNVITYNSESTIFSGQFPCKASLCQDGDAITFTAKSLNSALIVSSIDYTFIGTGVDGKPISHHQTATAKGTEDVIQLTLKDLPQLKEDTPLIVKGIFHHSQPIQPKKKITPATEGEIIIQHTGKGDVELIQIYYYIVPDNGSFSKVALTPVEKADTPYTYTFNSIQFQDVNGKSKDILIQLHTGVFKTEVDPICQIQASYAGTVQPRFIVDHPNVVIIPITPEVEYKRSMMTITCTNVFVINNEEVTIDNRSRAEHEHSALFSVQFLEKASTVASALTLPSLVDVMPYDVHINAFTYVYDYATAATGNFVFANPNHIDLQRDYISFDLAIPSTEKPRKERIPATVQIVLNDKVIISHHSVKLTTENRIENIPLNLSQDDIAKYDNINLRVAILLEFLPNGKSVYTTTFTYHHHYQVDDDGNTTVKSLDVVSASDTRAHKPVFTSRYPVKLTLAPSKIIERTRTVHILINTITDAIDSFSIRLETFDYLFMKVRDDDKDPLVCKVNGKDAIAKFDGLFTIDGLERYTTLTVEHPIKDGKKMELECDQAAVLALTNENRKESDQLMVFIGTSKDEPAQIATRKWNILKDYHDGLNPNKFSTLIVIVIIILGAVGLTIFAILYYRQYKRSKARELEYEREDGLLRDHSSTSEM